MNAYFVYSLILFGATFFAYIAQISEEQENSKNLYYISIFIAFLIMFVPAAIRYNIGTDYRNYVNYFHDIQVGIAVPKEPLYILLNKIIDYLNLDFQWFFVVTSFLTYFILFKALPKEILAFGIFWYILRLYFSSYDEIRQAVAISVSLYAFKDIDNIKKYYLWLILISTIHLGTGIILMLVRPFIKIKINKIFMIIFIFVLFVLITKFNLSSKILGLIAAIFPKYSWYLHSDYVYSAKIGSGLGILVRILLAFAIIFSKDIIKQKFPNAKIDIIINFYFLYLIAYLFAIQIHIFGRVETVFEIYFVLAVSYFLATFDGKSRIFPLLVFSFVYYIFFLASIAKNTINDENKGAGINPYQTILQRNYK